MTDEYLAGKGTIRFQADSPLPAALIRTLVKTQIAARTTPPLMKARKVV